MAENNEVMLLDKTIGESSPKEDKVTLENVMRRCGNLGRYQFIHYMFLNRVTVVDGIIACFYAFGVAETLFTCSFHQSYGRTMTNSKLCIVLINFLSIHGNHQILNVNGQMS